jgi:hypothetical protein
MSYVKKLIFFASPGDIKTERRYAEDVILELNRTVAADKGVELRGVRWEKDAFPGYFQDAQSHINAQIAEMSKYALFVGIMWNRLGKATPRAASGTVEEFERAIDAFKQKRQPEIWFYFRQYPSKLETEEQLEQRKKVLNFKKKLEENGLPWTYTTPTDFRDKFRVQLSLWLTQRTQPVVIAADSISVLDQADISEIVKYLMSPSIFHHLCGIAIFNEYIYHHEFFQREMYFLRDHGLIQTRSFASVGLYEQVFLEFYKELDGKNLVEFVEPTRIGWLYVKLRRGDIPEIMLEDKDNLKIDPSTL